MVDVKVKVGDEVFIRRFVGKYVVVELETHQVKVARADAPGGPFGFAPLTDVRKEPPWPAVPDEFRADAESPLIPVETRAEAPADVPANGAQPVPPQRSEPVPTPVAREVLDAANARAAAEEDGDQPFPPFPETE